MVEFDPAPTTTSEDARKRWQEGADTFDRVYDTLLGTTALTPYSELAGLADCSANAAKKHLDRLVEMGIARTDSESQPARYARDDGYLEWQEASRIARELSVDEIIDRVRDLEAEQAAYEEEFGTSEPTTVSVFEQEDHDSVHERMTTISDWEAVRRDIRLYELARQLAQNDGHLLPA